MASETGPNPCLTPVLVAGLRWGRRAIGARRWIGTTGTCHETATTTRDPTNPYQGKNMISHPHNPFHAFHSKERA